jgi:hypothetical protein
MKLYVLKLKNNILYTISILMLINTIVDDNVILHYVDFIYFIIYQ